MTKTFNLVQRPRNHSPPSCQDMPERLSSRSYAKLHCKAEAKADAEEVGGKPEEAGGGGTGRNIAVAALRARE